MEGITDVIVVKHKSGEYRSTKFFACVGSSILDTNSVSVDLYINKTLINDVKFALDKYGYVHPNSLSSKKL